MVELDDFADQLYEPETRVEEQDLRLLKAIVTDDSAARQLNSFYSSDLFVGDAKPFADAALAYFKSYNTLPTRRVIQDFAPEAVSTEKFTHIWDELDRLEYNKSEFSYDLDKIKDRYSQQEVYRLKSRLEDVSFDTDQVGDILQDVRSRLDRTEKIRRGKELPYTQKTMKEYLPDFRQEFVLKSKNPDLGKGVLTGYSYLDYITNGLQPSDMVIVGAQTGGGKALPLDTLIPTPDGFKCMDEIKPGSQVFGRDGSVCNVVAESAIYNDPGWKFILNDGSEVISHDNHDWLTFDNKEQGALSRRTPESRKKQKEKRKSRAVKNTKPWLTKANKNRKYDLLPPPEGTVRSSKEIAKTLTVHKNKRTNHAIPNAKPIHLPDKKLLIEPYLFGCWLGDGTSIDGQITTMDQYIVDTMKSSRYKMGAISTNKNKDGKLSKASAYRLLGLRAELKTLGVWGNKHIPNDYLWSSTDQRLALLQGLMDTDGFVSKRGHIIFYNTNKNIIDGVAH